MLKVTDVKVIVPEFVKEGEGSKLKAFARVCLEDSLMIHGIRIIEGNDRTFVAMPDRKTSQGFKDVVHPLNKELGDVIEAEVIAAYEELGLE